MANSIKTRLLIPLRSFVNNRDAVYELLDFDATVIDLAVKQLSTTEQSNKRAWEKLLKSAGELHMRAEHELPAHLSIQRVTTFLQNIRSHGSLKPKYDVMINQCVVLLVAHFASGCRSIFREAVRIAVETGASEAVLNFKVQARAGDLHGMSGSTVDLIAEQIVSGSGMSFQDMQSIGRALTTYFGLTMAWDETVNDIVIAHASRHLIVHSGRKVDRQFMKQVRDAHPRSIKPRIAEGLEVQYSGSEVHAVGQAMTTYLHRMADDLERALMQTV